MNKIGKLLLSVVVIIAAAYYSLITYVVPGYIKQMLPAAESMAREYINGSVKIGNVTWNGGLAAEVDGVTFYDTENNKVAVIPHAEISFKPWLAVIDPVKVISRIQLEKPEIFLSLDEKEKWNLQNFLKPSDSDKTPFYGLLEVKNGLLEVTTPYGSWDFAVDAAADGGSNPNFAVQAAVNDGQSVIEASGILTTDGEGSLFLECNNFIVDQYASAAQHYAQIENLQGNIAGLKLNWSSKNKDVKISGQGEIEKLQGNTVYAGQKHDFMLDGKVQAQNSVISLKDVLLSLDKQEIHADGSVDISDLENIKGELNISAPVFNWQDYEVKNVKLHLMAEDSLLDIKDSEADYGGGKVKVNGHFDLNDKVLIADAEFAQVQQSIKDEIITLNGKAAVIADMSDEKIGLHMAADTFNLNWRSLNINQISFDGNFLDNVLTIEHLGALAEKGSLALKGTAETNGNLDIHVRMMEFPIAPVLEAAGVDGSGYCSTGFELHGTFDNPEFSGIVQLNDVDFMHQQIENAYGNISLKDNILSADDFQAFMKQGKHVINGYLDFNTAEPVVDMVIETAGVRAEPLIAASGSEIKLTGNIDNIVHIQGNMQDNLVSGEVHLTDGSIEGYLLDEVEGRYSYNNGLLSLKDFVIRALATEVTLNGTMDKEQRLDFYMDAKDFMLNRIPLMEKDFAIDGYVDAKGYLQGTLSNPYFSGDISSQEIRINGQSLTDVEGSLKSNGSDINSFNISCKQPYDDGSSGYGMFKGELNVNLAQRFVQGNIVALWGDLGNIMQMCRQYYKIDGIVQGEIAINPEGKGSGININVWADDVTVHDLNYYRMMFRGNLKNGILSFDDVKILEKKDIEDQGIITLDGQVDFRRRKLDVDVTSQRANPAIVTLFMEKPIGITGEADMAVTIDGTFDNPTAKWVLDVNKGSLAGVAVDNLTTTLSLYNDNIRVENFTASKDIYKLKAEGDIPVDLLRSSENRKNINSQMKITFDLSEARLDVLPAFSPMIESADGDIKGNIILSGTLEEPMLYGSIKIDGGHIKVASVDSIINNINSSVEFKGQEVLLHNLSAELGKGSITASGSYALRTGENDSYRLNVKADNAEIVSEIFTGKINSELEIVPQRYYNFKMNPPSMDYRPLIKGQLRLDDVLINMPTVPELGEGESNFGTQIDIVLGPDIHLFNKYLYDIWLEGGIQLKGSTVYPLIDGKIKAKKGTITYLRTPFKIQSAGVAWPVPGTFLPTVNLDSTARFSRYDIIMKVNGPLEEMELQLASNPPLEQNTIVRMLTLQRDNAGTEDITNEDIQNLMTAGLQMTVLGDVELLVKQTVGLDQFRIYTGKVRSGVGFEGVNDKNHELTPDEKNQYNLLISKYLNDKIMVGYTTSFDGVDRSIFGQYDINKRLNFTYSRSYDISDEAEEWYGMEYKVTF